ncbi:hypothetical protein D3C84_1187460 [compost metagenome]
MADRVEQNVVELEIVMQQHRCDGPRVGYLRQPAHGLARSSTGRARADQRAALAPALGGTAEESVRTPEFAKADSRYINLMKRSEGVDRH